MALCEMDSMNALSWQLHRFVLIGYRLKKKCLKSLTQGGTGTIATGTLETLKMGQTFPLCPFTFFALLSASHCIEIQISELLVGTPVLEGERVELSQLKLKAHSSQGCSWFPLLSWS